MIFETHAHYDDEVFNEDREQLLAGLPEKGIGRVINVGASIETTRTTLALAEAYDYIYAAVGVHPSDIVPSLTSLCFSCRICSSNSWAVPSSVICGRSLP